jgi:hypothetical protein
MNAIQQLKAELSYRANLSNKGDLWFLDITHGTEYITVCWREDKGFALSNDMGAIHEADCTEHYPDLPTVKKRIEELL